MGYFSYNCKTCQHPALSAQAADHEINTWMTDCVVLFENGDRVSGEYNGYGRVGIYSAADQEVEYVAPCLYHRACWEIAGKPDYSGPSTDADDQGWFFNDGDHDMLDPRSTHEPGTLERAQAARAGRKRGSAFRQKDEDADEGTYEELSRVRSEEARRLTHAECIALWGYDPVVFERRVDREAS